MKRLFKKFRPARGIILLGALAAILAAGPVAVARADKGDLSPRGGGISHSLPTMNITLGKGEVVNINGSVADVMVANPAIADVIALKSDRLYIVGAQLGDTNILVVDSAGNVLERLDIHVKLDELAIQNYLEELYPDEDVKVKALNDQVILTGTVSNPAIANKITQVVAAYIGEVVNLRGRPDDIIVNLLQVTGEQQVMLKVRILEASKNLLKEIGIETDLGSTGPGFDNLDGSVDINTGTGLTEDPFALGALVFQDGTFGPLSILVSALEDNNMAHILAEPNLTAISGQEAGFLAGGEFPVPAGRDSEGNVIIQFRSFGVSLNFRPTVLSESRISLQLNTEVSSLAQDQSVTLSGVDVPGLNIRRASTTVEVPSGGGLMIGGLLESKAVKGMAGLPGIRDVPVLGDLISSRSFNREETELVVLVTAYLVKPYKETGGQQNPAPEDKASPLAAVFADNIRRIYGRRAPDLLSDGSHYGYLID